MQIRAATLNVWALPGPFARDVSDRMQAIGSRLEQLDADVVAFQEVWTEEARRTLLGAGRRAGFAHAYHETESLGGSGLLTLSRLPIEAVDFERYRARGEPDRIGNGEYLSGKGFALTLVQTPSGPLTLVNTHLHARYERFFDHGYRGHRTAQLIQLASRISRIDHPVVVMGDFNFGEEHPEYEVFTGLTGARDVAAELDQREPTVDRSLYYRRNSRKRKRADMIFVRDGQGIGTRAVGVDRIFDEPLDLDGKRAGYSNHAGVSAVVELAASELPATARLQRGAIELASRLLDEGRSNAERRREDRRELAGVGLGVALVAAAGRRSERLCRRRFLRGSLTALSLAALLPSVGVSVLTELVTADPVDAFDDAEQWLARFANTDVEIARS